MHTEVVHWLFMFSYNITEGKLNFNAFLQGFSLDLSVILTLTHLFDN